MEVNTNGNSLGMTKEDLSYLCEALVPVLQKLKLQPMHLVVAATALTGAAVSVVMAVDGDQRLEDLEEHQLQNIAGMIIGSGGFVDHVNQKLYRPDTDIMITKEGV